MYRMIGIVAGIVGAFTMSLVAGLGRLLGLSLDLEMLLGALFTESVDKGTWLIGLALHTALGGIFGYLYAVILSAPRLHPGALPGAFVGLCHGVIAGVAANWMAPPIPAAPDALPPPGLLFLGYGVSGAIAFVLIHVCFGAIVGAMLARSARSMRTRRGSTSIDAHPSRA